jgi:uncharacterized protein YbjT (DUF2867 family)
MKNVLVIGAHGQVGRLIVTQMNESAAFSPKALFRKEEQKTFFEDLGVDYSIVDLEEDVASLAKAMKGMDAVVFSAGSGGSTGYDKTLTIDLDGAVKAMEAAQQAGVQRFVMISALHADRREFWEVSGIKPYYVAKHYADLILKSSGLDYTILRPGRLFNKEGSGTITTTDPANQEGVPREDVARLALAALNHPNTIGKTISFNQGNTPIDEAVNSI